MPSIRLEFASLGLETSQDLSQSVWAPPLTEHADVQDPNGKVIQTSKTSGLL